MEALTRPFSGRLRLRTPVDAVTRSPDHVLVKPRGGEAERFDEVVLATHSDQSLALLSDASDREDEILGAIPYQPNEAVLHTDVRMLPRRRHAWASWNYHLLAEPKPASTVTYHMNRLQSLGAEREFCVTLNRTEAVDPAHVIRTIPYAHPGGCTRLSDPVAARPRGDVEWSLRISSTTSSEPCAGALTDGPLPPSEMFTAFPDFGFTVERVVAEGDAVVVKWHADATFTGGRFQILREAEETDQAEDRLHGKDRRGDELPEEMRTPEGRRQALAEAKRRLEERKGRPVKAGASSDPEMGSGSCGPRS